MAVGINHLYEFGPYRIDPARSLLLKDEKPVPLTSKAFETLLVLVELRDQVVSKDELMKRVWPDTFVEESNLTQHISMVRKALGETPQDRHYIVTLPGKGYRFAERVRSIPEDGSGVAVESPSRGAFASREPIKAEEQAAPHFPSDRRTWVWGLAAVTVMVATLIATLLILRSSRPIGLHESDSVLVSEFVNSTADPVFDDALKTALHISLRQSPFLDVLSDSQVAKTLQLMARPLDVPVTAETTRELCLRAGGKAYISGAIGKLDSEYVLALKAVNCQSGDTMAEEQVTAENKEKVLEALGKAADKLREKLGESLNTVQRFNTQLAQVTTSSLDALKAYSLGRKLFWEKGENAALPYSQRAIELDPNFAMAYRAVGVEYAALGEVERANQYITKAFQLREHASEREKLEITATYYANVTGDLDKAIEAYQEEIESYPRDGLGYLNLGVEYGAQGQYEKAAEVVHQGMRLAPDQSRYHFALSDFTLALQQLDEARQIIHDAQARKLDEFEMHGNLYALDFLTSDSSAMTEELKWFASKREYEDFGSALAADTEAFNGHLSKAQALTSAAAGSAIRSDNKETAALWKANAALRQAAFGNSAEALRLAAGALRLARASEGVESEAALALAMGGNAMRAESLARDLGRRFPQDTQMQSLWLPAIHAQISLSRNDPASALDVLQAASTIELGNIPFSTNVSCLYPIYLRGVAYVAIGQGRAGSAEFQKILDHSGIVWNCWTGALAHLGVARANALQARTSHGAEADAARVRALAAYKDFLTLWKDADPDIPIYKQAKAEYAKLQ